MGILRLLREANVVMKINMEFTISIKWTNRTTQIGDCFFPSHRKKEETSYKHELGQVKKRIYFSIDA